MSLSYHYDQTDDALDISLAHGEVARTEQIDSGTLVDLDERGRVLSIEVIRPARPWPLEPILQRYSVGDDDARLLHSLRSGVFGEPAELAAQAQAGELVTAS